MLSIETPFESQNGVDVGFQCNRGYCCLKFYFMRLELQTENVHVLLNYIQHIERCKRIYRLKYTF